MTTLTTLTAPTGMSELLVIKTGTTRVGNTILSMRVTSDETYSKEDIQARFPLIGGNVHGDLVLQELTAHHKLSKASTVMINDVSGFIGELGKIVSTVSPCYENQPSAQWNSVHFGIIKRNLQLVDVLRITAVPVAAPDEPQWISVNSLLSQPATLHFDFLPTGTNVATQIHYTDASGEIYVEEIYQGRSRGSKLTRSSLPFAAVIPDAKSSTDEQSLYESVVIFLNFVSAQAPFTDAEVNKIRPLVSRLLKPKILDLPKIIAFSVNQRAIFLLFLKVMESYWSTSNLTNAGYVRDMKTFFLDCFPQYQSLSLLEIVAIAQSEC